MCQPDTLCLDTHCDCVEGKAMFVLVGQDDLSDSCNVQNELFVKRGMLSPTPTRLG